MMFEDIARLQEAYKLIESMTEAEIAAEDLPLQCEIVESLHHQFDTIYDAIADRMHWDERQAR